MSASPPVDVSPTGNTASHEPQPVTEAPEDWSKNSYVQIEGGFLAGVALGFVPFGGVGHQVLDTTHVLPHGSSNARFGLAVGQIFGGIALAVGGATGELLGGALSVSGIGALGYGGVCGARYRRRGQCDGGDLWGDAADVEVRL